MNDSAREEADLVSSVAVAGGIADDPRDGYVVRFGGFVDTLALGSTWTYRAGEWRNVTIGAQPSARGATAMAYDYAGGYVVLFGGANLNLSNPQVFGDTWAYEHGTWTQIVTSTAPPARWGASMAYDPQEDGVVLFGGMDFSGALNDTWLFSDGAWTRLDATGIAPPARSAGGLSWDAADGQLVEFGGGETRLTVHGIQIVAVNDTWSFLRGNWTNLTIAHAPPASPLLVSMVNDTGAGKLVLLENLNVSRAGDCQTWSFSVDAWTQEFPAVQPCDLEAPESTWDSEDQADLFYAPSFGLDLSFSSPTWEYASGNWSQVDNYSVPGPLLDRATAFDTVSGDMYTVDGLSASDTVINQTYRFDGSEWHALQVSVAPPARIDASLAYDPNLGGLVLFGGDNLSVGFNDTWLLSGNRWTELNNGSHAPSPRFDTHLVFDPVTGSLLLFGGLSSANLSALNDTWEMSASGWSELQPADSPSARYSAGFTFDPNRGAPVLFGGVGGIGSIFPSLNDTWEFVDGDWIEISSITVPPGRLAPYFAYDPAEHGDLLFGGTGANSTLGDAWVLTATAWLPFTALSPPGPRAGGTAFFDNATETIGLFGGGRVVDNGTTLLAFGDFWQLDDLNLSASANVTDGAAPLHVAFETTVGSGATPVSVSWSFGDGQSAPTPNATHVYDSGGSYRAEVTARDALGLVDEWSVTINATGVGVAPLTLLANATPLTGYAPLRVSFSASGSNGVGPYTYSWDFGDGATASGANTSHTYAAVEVYNATVTVTDTIGSTASESFSINATFVPIPPPPPPPSCCLPPPPTFNVTINASATSGTAPLTITFTAVPTLTGVLAATFAFNWSFGDGSAGASGNPVSHLFGQGGVYAIVVMVSAGSGLTALGSVNVSVAPAPPGGTTPSGGTLPVSDLLIVVALAAIVLVAATAYLARTARERVRRQSGMPSTEGPETPGDEPEPDPPSKD